MLELTGLYKFLIIMSIKKVQGLGVKASDRPATLFVAQIKNVYNHLSSGKRL